MSTAHNWLQLTGTGAFVKGHARGESGKRAKEEGDSGEEHSAWFGLLDRVESSKEFGNESRKMDGWMEERKGPTFKAVS